MKTSLRACLLAVVAAIGLTACGGSSGGTPESSASPSESASTGTAAPASQPSDPAAAKAEITRVWEKFFNASTDQSKAAKNLLEDAANLGQALKIAAREDRQTHLDRRAKVTLIKFFDAETANVTWTLLNGKTPVLPNASGQAKLIGGHWLVSKLTFCTLVELGNNGKPVPGCS